MSFRAALLVLVCLVGAPVVRASDPQEDRLHRLIARIPPGEQDFFAKAKYAGEYAMSDIVTYSNREGRFLATFTLPAALVKQFEDPAPLLIAIKGSPHIWALHRRKSGTLDEGLSMVTLSCYAPDELWPFSRFSMSSDGVGVLVAGVQMYAPREWQQRLTLGQNPHGLTAAWRLAADKFESRRMVVPNLEELSARVPTLAKGYLLPILRRLGPGRSTGDVYRVFDQIPADPAVAARLRPILRNLESEDADIREAATRSLKALGRPGILASLRLNPEALSPEQSNRLSAIYAAEGWVHVSDVEAARVDADFLASCTEDEDERVRTAATNMLAALQAVRQLKR